MHGFRNHMQTLGQRLRAEREKMGRSIAELATLTRIRAEYFEAIEKDCPEEFPGPFFYRSFLRQYAELLELPKSVIEPEIQRSVDEESAMAAERAVFSRRKTGRTSRLCRPVGPISKRRHGVGSSGWPVWWPSSPCAREPTCLAALGAAVFSGRT